MPGSTTLTEEEFARFTLLNERYRSQYGFPFILPSKALPSTKFSNSFEARINNSKDAEFAMALEQIMRIFRFRIEDRVRG